MVAVTVILAGAAACGARPHPGFFGHWSHAELGEHYIVREGSTVRVVYTHGDGRVVGEVEGNTMTGWWTQAPTRQPPHDAGEVTFTFSVVNGVARIDGVRHSDAGPTDWDLTFVEARIPPEIQRDFEDGTTFLARYRQP